MDGVLKGNEPLFNIKYGHPELVEGALSFFPASSISALTDHVSDVTLALRFGRDYNPFCVILRGFMESLSEGSFSFQLYFDKIALPSRWLLELSFANYHFHCRTSYFRISLKDFQRIEYDHSKYI